LEVALISISFSVVIATIMCWDGQAVESCTILTTDANKLTKPIHRMAVIVDPSDYKQWLDPAERLDALRELLRPYPPKPMEA
jgi:putative SOS response-associated peptidase YedK